MAYLHSAPTAAEVAATSFTRYAHADIVAAWQAANLAIVAQDAAVVALATALLPYQTRDGRYLFNRVQPQAQQDALVDLYALLVWATDKTVQGIWEGGSSSRQGGSKEPYPVPTWGKLAGQARNVAKRITQALGAYQAKWPAKAPVVADSKPARPGCTSHPAGPIAACIQCFRVANPERVVRAKGAPVTDHGFTPWKTVPTRCNTCGKVAARHQAVPA